MSSALNIEVTITGAGEADQILQKARNTIASRAPMHARMAVYGRRITRKHLWDDTSHATAGRLGAKPTGFRFKNARLVEAQSDENEARVVIPRDTGLGRAFGPAVIRPGSGKTYISIPGHQTTYGKSPRNFPEDTFHFRVIESFRTFTALVFSNGSYKGEVGFWLKREVRQKQDRTLLPPDEEYYKAARGGAVDYLTEQLRNA